MVFACITAAAACVRAPAVAVAPDPETLNQSCEGCHADAARSWRSSNHARAFTNAVFQDSFAREPSKFCRDCHAPIAAAPALGIACSTCHGSKGHGQETAPCATCHEFPFPDNARRAVPALMQRTTEEHRVSRFADTSCESCHMPAKSHAFTVDASLLRRALVANASRTARGLVLELSPGDVGHAMPTGDLFRRLVVVADAEGEDNRLLGHAERALARHFEYDEAKVQQELSDDRVQGPMRLELPLPSALEIHWRVEWQRVSAMHGDEAVVAERIVVAEGVTR